MSRGLRGWKTTRECQDNGWPIRYYWNDDEYVEVATCTSQTMAEIAAWTLNDSDAKPIDKEE